MLHSINPNMVTDTCNDRAFQAQYPSSATQRTTAYAIVKRRGTTNSSFGQDSTMMTAVDIVAIEPEQEVDATYFDRHFAAMYPASEGGYQNNPTSSKLLSSFKTTNPYEALSDLNDTEEHDPIHEEDVERMKCDKKNETNKSHEQKANTKMKKSVDDDKCNDPGDNKKPAAHPSPPPSPSNPINVFYQGLSSRMSVILSTANEIRNIFGPHLNDTTTFKHTSNYEASFEKDPKANESKSESKVNTLNEMTMSLSRLIKKTQQKARTKLAPHRQYRVDDKEEQRPYSLWTMESAQTLYGFPTTLFPSPGKCKSKEGDEEDTIDDEEMNEAKTNEPAYDEDAVFGTAQKLKSCVAGLATSTSAVKMLPTDARKDRIDQQNVNSDAKNCKISLDKHFQPAHQRPFSSLTNCKQEKTTHDDSSVLWFPTYPAAPVEEVAI